MFFFIGGIQPKTVNLDEQPRMCPSCGLYQARLRRVDHYLSFFFIPLFCVKKGVPFLQCQSCGTLGRESGEVWGVGPGGPGDVCRNCGRALERSFRFCPFCGKPL